MKRFIALFGAAVLTVLAVPAHADFQVSGKFMYENLPIDINGFQSPHPSAPVRLVDVRVIDNTTSASLATGATDNNGNFSFTVTDASVRDIAILALTQSGAIANLNHYVTEWATTAVHAYQGILVAGHDPNTAIDMGTVVMHFRAGAEAFNLYDSVLDASDFIASMQAGTRPTGVRIRYTLDSNPDVAYYNGIVNIGGNFGYDDTICMHEFGHFVQSAYGAFSDNPGGGHYIGDSAQDPRLSFGEGWPTFFGSSARSFVGTNHPQVYLNSTGDSTTGQYSFSYDLELYGPGGAANEQAVQACLWDIADGNATADNSPGTDDEPGYQMDRTDLEVWSFTRTYLSQPPFSGNLTYEDFHDLWLANVVPSQATELGQVEKNLHGIEYLDDAYENDDSFGSPGTYHTFEDIGMARTTHHTTWPNLDEDWVRIQGLAGIAYQVETNTMRDGADPVLEIQNSVGAVVGTNDNQTDPGAGSFNRFEFLRAIASYTPATTQDLYVRLRRSTAATWGVVSKYGNWNLRIRTTSVPATYPNITTNPSFTYFVSLAQNTQSNANLIVTNTGTVDALVYNLVEASGPIGWVSETPLTDTVSPNGGTKTSVLTFDATGLSVGAYVDSLEVHSNDPNLPIKYLTLNLTVTPGLVAVNDGQAARATWLGENSPNPFNPLTTIRFSVKQAGQVSLVVYDVRGREVRRLVDGVREAGEHSVAWNGVDGVGRAVSSGIYFYRLSADQKAITRKMVMTK
jgi:hypothetical protein